MEPLDIFETLSNAKRLAALNETFPGGIRYDDVTLTFAGRSVVVTSNKSPRTGYKTWASRTITRIPLSNVRLLDYGDSVEFIFNER